MKYTPSSRDALDAHCREVIRSCLNIVEQHGDTYVAIHKDDEIDCVVLVSMIRSYPIMSIIVADKILFADINADQMYGVANELNLDSVTGWHSVFLADDSMIYNVPAMPLAFDESDLRRPPCHAERMHQRIQARQRPPYYR